MEESPDLASLDPLALRAIRELDADGAAGLFEQVVAMYLEATPALLQQIEQGLATGNAASVRMAAHTLKSSSANLGARALAQAAAGVEHAARQGALEGHTQTAAQIRREFDAVRRALEHETGKAAG